MKETILTGVRVNEEPTLGNFLGAYLPMVQLTKEHASTHRINMFVPDLHSITTPINYKELQSDIIGAVKYYIAAGLDVSTVNIYRQSYISAHSELAWILDCFTHVGELRRMTQFKEKSGDSQEAVTVGLFNYPVLMAADILLYGAKYVPVGDDQYQHLEVTRDIAKRFNNKFGDIFVMPLPTHKQSKFMGRDEGLRVRSLTNPEKKMSKSDKSEGSKISLGDAPEVAVKKIMSATTDNLGKIQFDMLGQPGVSNLLQIQALLQGKLLQDVISEWSGQTSYGDLKRVVAHEVNQFLSELQAKVAQISDREVLEALEASEARVRPVAEAKLLEVQQAVGLR